MEKESFLAALMAALATYVQADAMIGAMFGSAFFMMLPFIEGLLKRFFMSFVSAGCGYSVGIAVNAPHAMWSAIAAAALAVIILTSAVEYFSTVKFSDVIIKALEILRMLK